MCQGSRAELDSCREARRRRFPGCADQLHARVARRGAHRAVDVVRGLRRGHELEEGVVVPADLRGTVCARREAETAYLDALSLAAERPFGMGNTVEMGM